MPNNVDATTPAPPDLCAVFLATLPISGASIAVVAQSGARLTICSSDALSARVDELQFELGEGPQWEVARTGDLVVIQDVAADTHDRWPVFGAAISALPIGSLFGVPMRMGAVTLGVATLYSATPRELTRDEQVTALAIASAIAGPAAQQALRATADETSPSGVGSSTALRREVHQATGIILVQLNTTATVAYSRLQAYAFANGRTVQAVAHDVVAGSLTFEENSP